MPVTVPSRADRTSPRNPDWRSTAFVLLVVGAYCAGLWWLDRSNGTFQRLASAWHWLPVAVLPVFATYLVRFWRWRWLLRRSGHSIPFAPGLCAYLAGFALTATPGKAGELLRIRYFGRMGVPSSETLAVFVFERACDLLVILLLSLAAARLFPGLAMLGSSVLSFVLLLFVAAQWRAMQGLLERAIAHVPLAWARRTGGFALSATRALGRHLDVRALITSLGTGITAWSLTSAVFMGVCAGFGVGIDPLIAFGIYPLAMLVGALSFVPGGIGTTELAIVLMLNRLGIGTPDALAVAVGTRLVSLWFAMGAGGIAVFLMERRGLQPAAAPR
mgnify:CR=1 FL=1